MQPITADELAKAAANLKRIEDYLVVRTRWRTGKEAASALRSVDQGAVAITRTLDPYRDSHAIVVDWADTDLPEQMPEDTFDSARTAKLGDFMVRLSAWFKERAGSELATGADQLIGSIYSSLIRIHRAAESILGGSSAQPGVAESHPASSSRAAPNGPTRSPAEPRASGEREPGQPMPMSAAHAARSKRLVLENTVQTPLLEALHDEYELTATAKNMVTGFLEENGIEFAGHKLRRFHAEVRRCIERTPEGQVLVIKIGGVDGDRAPFFTYQPKAWIDAH